MEERQWRIPALLAALQADGFELSRATLYRIVDGRSAPPADICLWAMTKLGHSVDEQLGIRMADANTGMADRQLLPELEEALYNAGLRLLSRLMSPELASALQGPLDQAGAAPSAGAPVATAPEQSAFADESAYAVSEARLKLKARSREILEQMAGASVEESSGDQELPLVKPAQGRGGR